jgi:predicted outer membrane lipoprotein
VEPLLVLVVLPVLLGIAADFVFREPRKATFAAALATVAGVCLFVEVRGTNATWTWFAALLVSPLSVAFAVAAALFWYGHLQERARRKHRGH